MRRADREVTDTNEIESIISRCPICRIGLNDKGRVYIVALTFGYEKKGDERIFYFHGARSGRKIELIKKSSYAALEADIGYETQEGESPCDYTAYYKSIFAEGKIELIESEQERIHALEVIMRRLAPLEHFKFSPQILEKTELIRFVAEELSCKVHRR